MNSIEKLPLKSLRARVDLTQKQVAERIGIDRATYSNWENYITYPNALQLISLSKIFECSLDNFLFPQSTSFKLAEHGNYGCQEGKQESNGQQYV